MQEPAVPEFENVLQIIVGYSMRIRLSPLPHLITQLLQGLDLFTQGTLYALDTNPQLYK